jgi:hypothetical protein
MGSINPKPKNTATFLEGEDYSKSSQRISALLTVDGTEGERNSGKPRSDASYPELNLL